MSPKRAKSAPADRTKTSKTKSAKKVQRVPPPEADTPPKVPEKSAPEPGDIAQIQALKMDHPPDIHVGTTLSDTWYELSDFLRIFRVSRNTVKSWNKKGWLPISRVEKLQFVNKTDVENMMLRFRRSGPGDNVP